MSGPGETVTMIELEYTPVVLESHRNDLHKLYNPVPAEIRVRTSRQQLGAIIIRLGVWIGDLRSDIATEPPVAVSSQQARA